MIIDHNTLLFFDASCLIAAAGSPSGGSGFLLSLCAKGFLRGAASQMVLVEAERNIATKMGMAATGSFRRLVVITPLTIVALPPKKERAKYTKLVGDKDEHVLAAAISGQASFLLTLDKGLESRVNEATLPIRALSPGAFIKNELVNHVDYPQTR